MKFLILGAAMIAAASAIIAQIDPSTGEIINSLPGILVSKRFYNPRPTYIPHPLPTDPLPTYIPDPRPTYIPDPLPTHILDPLPTYIPFYHDWLTGILVSKKEAVSSHVRRETLDAAVDSSLLSKKEAISSFVRREVLDAAVDSNLLSKRIVALPTSSTLDWLTGLIVSKKEAIPSLVRKGAIDDAINDLTSLTKKEAIESLVVRRRAAIDTLDPGVINTIISK